MARFLLVGVLCLLTYYVVESRSVLESAGASLMDPLNRWDAREEMQRVARNVVAHERLTGTLPDADSAWHAWLEERYGGGGAERDGWGSTYRIVVWADSVGIVSPGPDRLVDTDDDLQVVAPRG